MGLIYATVGDHETAVKHFQLATEADQYLAVAYFQCGVSNFLLERFRSRVQGFRGLAVVFEGKPGDVSTGTGGTMAGPQPLRHLCTRSRGSAKCVFDH
jgi:hypothetical protein